MLWYSYDEMDERRRENEIVDIKQEDICLKTSMKYSIWLVIVAFLSLITFSIILKDTFIYITMGTTIFSLLIIIILYVFTRYKIIYNSAEKLIIIKRWYGSIVIEQNKLKKVYVRKKTNYRIERRN